MRRFVCACMLVTSVVACSGDGAEKKVATKGAWSVDATPVLDIFGTAEDGDALLLRPDGGTRLSNGMIVVADRFADGVRFFDPEGRLVRMVGRSGSGPGEFKSPVLVGQCGVDSVFVSDAQSRITVIDSAGQVVRSYRLRDSAGSLLGCSRHGDFAGSTSTQVLSRPRPDGSGEHYKAQFWLADAEGAITKSVGELPAFEMRPMGKVTRVALANDRLYVGTADSAFVDVYGLDGQPLASLGVGVPRRPATQRHYERVIELQVAPFADRDMREGGKRMLLEYPMPEFLPPYSALLTDPDGLLWVVTSIPGDDATELRAIGADGGIVAELRLPFDRVIYEVGRDYILGTYEDGDGEPHVVMYRIRRGE